MRAFLRNNGLTIALIATFLLSVLGMIWSGQAAHNDELRDHGAPLAAWRVNDNSVEGGRARPVAGPCSQGVSTTGEPVSSSAANASASAPLRAAHLR